MYRSSLYQKSDETLKNFSKIFNTDKNYPHLHFIPNRTETYDNDGIIYNELTGTFIGFDWEYRERYFSNCNFQFDTLGQYERKLIKPSIQLAIQCDTTETFSLILHKNNMELYDIPKNSKFIVMKIWKSSKKCLIMLSIIPSLILKAFKGEKK